MGHAAKLWCVALSRAKAQLLVIANTEGEALDHHPIGREIVQRAVRWSPSIQEFMR